MLQYADTTPLLQKSDISLSKSNHFESEIEADKKNNRYILYKECKEGYEFAGFYNPDAADEDYPDGYLALPFTSTYKGLQNLAFGTVVYNVIGSTGDDFRDPGIGVYQKSPNWVDIWFTKTQGRYNRNHCYIAGSGDQPVEMCDGIICGGHMVLTPADINAKAKDTVLIVPICSRHNHLQKRFWITTQVEAMTLCYRA